MLDYKISIKTFAGAYKTVRCKFENREHFNNWFDDTCKDGNKIIGIFNTKKDI